MIKVIGKALYTLYDIGRCAVKGMPSEWVQTPPAKPWTMRHKLSELSEDSGLSPDYLAGLIKACKSKASLDKIGVYLHDTEKTANLTSEVSAKLITAWRRKWTELDKQEVMEHMYEIGKEMLKP